MNGGKQGDQNPRPLAGRTTYSRIKIDVCLVLEKVDSKIEFYE